MAHGRAPYGASGLVLQDYRAARNYCGLPTERETATRGRAARNRFSETDAGAGVGATCTLWRAAPPCTVLTRILVLWALEQ